MTASLLLRRTFPTVRRGLTFAASVIAAFAVYRIPGMTTRHDLIEAANMLAAEPWGFLAWLAYPAIVALGIVTWRLTALLEVDPEAPISALFKRSLTGRPSRAAASPRGRRPLAFSA
jgi:hypothetical protein